MALKANCAQRVQLKTEVFKDLKWNMIKFLGIGKDLNMAGRYFACNIFLRILDEYYKKKALGLGYRVIRRWN